MLIVGLGVTLLGVIFALLPVGDCGSLLILGEGPALAPGELDWSMCGARHTTYQVPVILLLVTGLVISSFALVTQSSWLGFKNN